MEKIKSSFIVTILCCVTADVANRIAGSNENMKTLVRCCESSGHEGVKFEASRMLALIAKQAKAAGETPQGFQGSREHCHKIVGNKGTKGN